MNHYYADLHVHIGQAKGSPVKITASRNLTLKTIIEEAAQEKGLNLIGIVDCGSPLVRSEIEDLLEDGTLQISHSGGLISKQGIALILGVEIESAEGVHFVIYLPDLNALDLWAKLTAGKMRNPNLSTQKINIPAYSLIDWATAAGGMFVVAHAFTPHKGAYGCWVKRLSPVFREKTGFINALELGLSADTDMADLIQETSSFTYLSNSDAHSPDNIGREYNLLRVKSPDFEELKLALSGKNGRRVLANYGLNPRLGKYHRSYCPYCQIITEEKSPIFICEQCGRSMIPGVWDRIMDIADYQEPHHPIDRPPYNYRVPLRFIPGIGPMTLQRLKKAFASEIYIAEQADIELIAKESSSAIAGYIQDMRNNSLNIIPGGGGIFGRIQKSDSCH